VARRQAGAFTLIELLLVITILGIISAVAVPAFVRSVSANRLQTAALRVVIAGRYARSMAVLKRRPMDLVFSGQRVVAGSLTNRLDGIVLKVKKTSDGSDITRVTYEMNGTCEPYEVLIADEKGNRADLPVITVDQLGSARTMKAWHSEIWQHEEADG
jgi:prepilin-type N-terminal cleavage/methylation domain-containing protein